MRILQKKKKKKAKNILYYLYKGVEKQALECSTEKKND